MTAEAGSGARSVAARRALTWPIRALLADAPGHPARPIDRAAVPILGLRLPLLATTALVVATMVVLVDMSFDLLPRSGTIGTTPGNLRMQAFERIGLFLGLPLVALAILGEDPRRYGLSVGDWRRGLPLAVGGCLVMVPVILAAARIPEVAAWYRTSAAPPSEVIATAVLDLVPAEFLFRGFLLFALLRAIGPIGVVVAAVPFAFGHVGKPDVETMTTLGGGIVFGWVAWRTGSILYGAAFHVFILVLIVLVAAAAPAAG